MSTALQKTNEESTFKLQKKAQVELLKGISRDWTAAEKAATEAGKQTILGINKLRSCGEKLKQLCGHEQIGLEFYQRVASSLPKSMNYRGARSAVHVSNRIEKDVDTVQEAMLVQKDLFAAMAEYREPKRIEAQTAHDHNPWSEFVNSTSSLTSLFGDLEIDRMESWDKNRLTTFVNTTKPIVEAYNRAVAMM